MPRRCHHSVIQVHEHAFECGYYGMIFFGVDRQYHDISRIMDSWDRGHMEEVAQQLSSMDIPVTHVDLGSMPQDIIAVKNRMEDLEKTLSIFLEVLKDALRT